MGRIRVSLTPVAPGHGLPLGAQLHLVHRLRVKGSGRPWCIHSLVQHAVLDTDISGPLENRPLHRVAVRSRCCPVLSVNSEHGPHVRKRRTASRWTLPCVPHACCITTAADICSTGYVTHTLGGTYFCPLPHTDSAWDPRCMSSNTANQLQVCP